jgi:hypothetical protein
MAEAWRGSPFIPFFEASCHNRYASTSIAASAKVNDRARAVRSDDLASPNVAEFVVHINFRRS